MSKRITKEGNKHILNKLNSFDVYLTQRCALISLIGLLAGVLEMTSNKVPAGSPLRQHICGDVSGTVAFIFNTGCYTGSSTSSLGVNNTQPKTLTHIRPILHKIYTAKQKTRYSTQFPSNTSNLCSYLIRQIRTKQKQNSTLTGTLRFRLIKY